MALGTHPVVTRGIVGTVKQDKKLVKKSSGELCKELEVKRQFGEIVSEIALDKYNPDKTGLKDSISIQNTRKRSIASSTL